jgi:DNA-binding NarL/FixJ family response regulator
MDSDIDAVDILVAVANPDFASALLQLLQACAPFPIKAAATNSMQQGLTYLEQNRVDIVMLEGFLPDCCGTPSISKLRQVCNAPAIVFARKLNRELEDQMKQLGADAVLPRDRLDAIQLIDTVSTVIATAKRSGPREGNPHPEPCGIDDEQLVAENKVFGAKEIMMAVERLQGFLSGRRLASLQRTLLRKLLGSASNNNDHRRER